MEDIQRIIGLAIVNIYKEGVPKCYLKSSPVLGELAGCHPA